MSGAPHNRFPDDIRMSAMSAVLVQCRPVKAVAAEHGVDPKTLRTWLCGKRGEYLKSPRANIRSGLDKRHCIGKSETTMDGRCPAWFYPENRTMHMCPMCRTKSVGLAI